MKSEIEKYKLKGKVYNWKYKDNSQNYPGWNFTADLEASESLTELLNLMSNCEWPTQKTILIDLPTQAQLNVPNNQNGNAKWFSKLNLILNFKKLESENHWIIKELDNHVEIQFGKAKLTELQKAIIEVQKGNGDFAVSDEKHENILYFWWNI